MSIPHLPALRKGRAYDSLDKVQVKNHRTGELMAEVSQVNAGIIRKDMAKINEARAALKKFTVAELIRITADASEHFLNGTLPLFDAAMALLGLGGFSTQHTRNLGMMGMHGEAWVNTAIQKADLLLAFGMWFDDRVTGNLKTYALHAKKIHVEIDASEIGKNVKVDVALVSDLLAALKSLGPCPEHRMTWAPIRELLAGDNAAVESLGESNALGIG